MKIGGSLRLTVPPEVAKVLNVKEGDDIEFDTANGDVIIRKVRSRLLGHRVLRKRTRYLHEKGAE